MIPFLQSVLHQQVKYCGNTLPHQFVSSGDTIEIKFKSDGTGYGSGFKLEYSLLSMMILFSKLDS